MPSSRLTQAIGATLGGMHGLGGRPGDYEAEDDVTGKDYYFDDEEEVDEEELLAAALNAGAAR